MEQKRATPAPTARLTENLADVRVQDPSAGMGNAALIEQLGAAAYTTGSDIVFGPGAYAPAATDGRELIGHELAHVLNPGDTRKR